MKYLSNGVGQVNGNIKNNYLASCDEFKNDIRNSVFHLKIESSAAIRY